MIDAIQTFIHVAAAGSFSAVARQHDLAVSSVARKIDQLEADLGARLFIRSPRAMRLSDAGERFLPMAHAIVGELEQARHALADLDAAPRGLLTVTAPAAFGRRHVMPAVASFLQRYPLIEIELHTSDRQVDLNVQRVDVAIRLGVLPDSDLVATRLAPVRRLACASPAYLERRGWPASPDELTRHACLTLASTPTPADWWRFPGVNGDLPLAVHGPLRSDDTEALLEAAVAGLGIVHLASWLVGERLRDGSLVELFPGQPGQPDADAARRAGSPAIHAVRMPGRSHEAKARLFIAHLKQQFGNPPYWDEDDPVMQTTRT